jgi:hypothetical protein
MSLIKLEGWNVALGGNIITEGEFYVDSEESLEMEIKKMVLYPGDILVIKSRAALSEEQIKNIDMAAKRVLPQGVKFMILDSDLELGILEDKSSGK